MKQISTLSLIAATSVAVAALPLVYQGEYFYIAGYSVLQFVILSTAWNLLGGLTGYVNFGSSAFFAIGVYAAVALVKQWSAPLWLCMAGGAVIAGGVGLCMGYLTLRLRGVYFSIATLALSVMLYTLVVNWDFVGAARGAYVIPVGDPPFHLKQWSQWLFMVLALVSGACVAIAYRLQHSKTGAGLAAIRDDEAAAEALGVPTLRLKLLITTVSGAMMGLVGATFPHFLNYVEPAAAFSLNISINSIAMPLIGGMQGWLGPVLGAVLLGGILQVTAVTWSSDANLIVIGATLVLFITLAPQGLIGLFKGLPAIARRAARRPARAPASKELQDHAAS